MTSEQLYRYLTGFTASIRSRPLGRLLADDVRRAGTHPALVDLMAVYLVVQARARRQTIGNG